MTRRVPVGVFFALFTISGFAGLIYQSIWSHYLKLFLGHAAYAQTLVLAIFMGGMAIGSWLVARLTGRLRNLLLGYALAELGIGLLAVAFHSVFVAATAWAFDSVLPALAGHGTDLFKWTLASILILPASILLGTTFPLMSGGVMRLAPDSGGRALAMLYFTNSFGAAIGVLASGFWLIDRFGLPGTILTAGLMNVALALAVWLAVRQRPPAPPVPALAAAAEPRARGRFVRAVLVVAFATGAASFVYEVTWIRMLTMGLGASSHSFEVMLAAFILGMALGALWLRNRIGVLRNDTAWLAGLLVAKAAFAVYAVWAYDRVLGFMVWVMAAVARSDGGYDVYTVAGLAASMAVMFPAAFCAGMTLPLATNALTSRGYGEASIGRVYAANTAGCILGAVLATHLGMEALGVKGLTGAGALIDFAMGVLVFAVTRGEGGGQRAVAAMAAVGALAVLALWAAPLDLLRMSSGVYRYGIFFDPRESRIAFYRDGKTATIAVVDMGDMLTIRTNGKPDASISKPEEPLATPDEFTMLLAAALPLSMKPGAEDIANIGFGSGLTTHSLLGSPRVKRVDTVEIERMMIEGAKAFEPRNQRAYDDPRSRVHIEDAKTFFASEGRRYDIVTSEPSNPWVSGVATLFSQEWYAQIKRYLKPDGLLVQWLQTYEIDVPLLSTVFQALGREFGDYAVFRTGTDLLIVATPGPKLPEMRADLFGFAGLAQGLNHLGFERLDDLRALRVGDRHTLAPLFAFTGYPANSDYFPILDQRAPRARFLERGLDGLRALGDGLAPVLPLLAKDEVRTPVERAHGGGRNQPGRVLDVRVGAEAIGIALSGAASRATLLSPRVQASALLVHALALDCRDAAAAWVDGLTDVAAAAMPYVAKADVDPLFAMARGSACWRSLPERERRRVALLEAINERNAAAVRDEAAWLLEHAPGVSDPQAASYLAAAVAGGLATGDVRKGVALRDAYYFRLPPAERDSLQMRLVLSHLALAAAGGPRK